jgi:FixJ family two-component response regulator
MLRHPRNRFERRRKPEKAEQTEFDHADSRREFKVFLVEDDELVRRTLKEALEEEKLVVEDYMTAMEFYRHFRDVVPGVLILDIRLPGMSGIALQEKLIQEDFPLPIVMISGHADVPIAVKALKNGASDFLCKPVKLDELLQAVRRAYHSHYSIKVDLDAELDSTEESLSRLTSREYEVLGYVVDGLSSREIATKLIVSTKTVEAHRARINDKMRSDSVAHLIRMCRNYEAET